MENLHVNHFWGSKSYDDSIIIMLLVWLLSNGFNLVFL